MNEYKVAGSKKDGERFSVVVKAQNVFHAMVLAEKMFAVATCSAVKVAK